MSWRALKLNWRDNFKKSSVLLVFYFGRNYKAFTMKSVPYNFLTSTWEHKMIWGKKEPCSRRTVRPQSGRICFGNFTKKLLVTVLKTFPKSFFRAKTLHGCFCNNTRRLFNQNWWWQQCMETGRQNAELRNFWKPYIPWTRVVFSCS